MDLSKLRYYIFSPNKSGLVSEHSDVYLRAYDAWRVVWSDVFKEIGHGGDLSADEFIRHDLCCVIGSESHIVAVHLYSYFDLANPLQLQRRYLSENFDRFSLERIRLQGCRSVMTMEYLSVTQDFRAAKTGFAAAEILIALGLKTFISDSTLDGVIACTRNSRKVNLMAESLGFNTIARDRSAHGETADLILFTQSDKIETSQLPQQELERLWNTKIDMRNTRQRKGKLHAA